MERGTCVYVCQHHKWRGAAGERYVWWRQPLHVCAIKRCMLLLHLSINQQAECSCFGCTSRLLALDRCVSTTTTTTDRGAHHPHARTPTQLSPVRAAAAVCSEPQSRCLRLLAPIQKAAGSSGFVPLRVGHHQPSAGWQSELRGASLSPCRPDYRAVFTEAQTSVLRALWREYSF